MPIPTEILEVADGLWVWRAQNPWWKPGMDWEPLVAATYVESGGERLVLDPIAPPERAEKGEGEGSVEGSGGAGSEVWRRLDARPPTVAVVLKPDHIRHVDLFVKRYGLRAFGPRLFFRNDIPETELEPIQPGSVLPGGLVALYDGRGRQETPLWLPEQRALVFADGLTAPGGKGAALRVWATPWMEERTLPALRKLLELPFEHVIVSHGEPVHDRAAYERALAAQPWGG